MCWVKMTSRRLCPGHGGGKDKGRERKRRRREMLKCIWGGRIPLLRGLTRRPSEIMGRQRLQQRRESMERHTYIPLHLEKRGPDRIIAHGSDCRYERLALAVLVSPSPREGRIGRPTSLEEHWAPPTAAKRSTDTSIHMHTNTKQTDGAKVSGMRVQALRGRTRARGCHGQTCRHPFC